ncbi:hypothetical protein HUJ04_001351 [Dendroctonus ponderosae]|nr:hypothetical protein HUJ04_001351 [Dendroctonus ponderosae]
MLSRKTLSTDERLLELEEELKHINSDVVGLSEVRRKRKQQLRLKSRHLFYHKGDNDSTDGGVGLRVAFLVLRLSSKYRLKVIQVYATTTTNSDEEVESCYEKLAAAMAKAQLITTLLYEI